MLSISFDRDYRTNIVVGELTAIYSVYHALYSDTTTSNIRVFDCGSGIALDPENGMIPKKSD